MNTIPATCRPELAHDVEAILSETAPKPFTTMTVEVVASRTGAQTLRLNERWLHSRMDPHREAERGVAQWDTACNRDEHDGVVVVGCGLGYHLAALTRALSGTGWPVLVVCESPEVLRACLTVREASWWCAFGPARMVPLWLPDVLAPVLRDMGIRRPAVFALPALEPLLPDHSVTVRNALAAYISRSSVNDATLRRFGKLWVRNTIHSVARHGVIPGIEPLAGIAAGTPAVVCGAGPTLDELLPELNRIAEAALVIAVDTAIIALQRAGITPDIAVVADPQYWNSRHLDHCDTTDTLLVAEPATHPRVLRLWRGPRLLSASLFPLGSYFDARSGRTLRLGAGGSVATSAWDLARIMGASTIGLIGIDLAFPHHRTHCHGSFFEERLHRVADRVHPSEDGLWHYLHGAQPRTVVAYNGRPVMSDARMDVYRRWFSEQARRFPDCSTVVLSPDGSLIEGITTAPAATLVSERSTRSVDRMRQALAELTASDARNHHTAENEAKSPSGILSGVTLLEALTESLATLQDIAERGIAICDAGPDATSTGREPAAGAHADGESQDRTRLHGAGGDEPSAHHSPAAPSPPSPLSVQETLAALEQIDAELQRFESREIGGFLASEALNDATAAAPATLEESILQARTIYAALRDGARYHAQLVARYHT